MGDNNKKLERNIELLSTSKSMIKSIHFMNFQSYISNISWILIINKKKFFSQIFLISIFLLTASSCKTKNKPKEKNNIYTNNNIQQNTEDLISLPSKIAGKTAHINQIKIKKSKSLPRLINQTNSIKQFITNKTKIKATNKKAIPYNVVHNMSQLSHYISGLGKYNIDYIIKGTMGGSILCKCVWALTLINDKKITHIKDINCILMTILKILNYLSEIKNTYKSNDIWNVDFRDIDRRLFGNLYKKNIKSSLKHLILDELSNNLPKNLNLNLLLNKIYNKFDQINANKYKTPNKPSIIKQSNLAFHANLMLILIFKRGILAPDDAWWKINKYLKDKSGIETYFKSKDIYKTPIATSAFLGEKIHVVVDNNFAKQILDQSPDVFDVGKVKKKVFQTFMDKNVGISHGKEWKNRRKLNDEVLCFPKLHKWAGYYNNYIMKIMKQMKLTNTLPKQGCDFFKTAKKIVSKVVFNDEKGIPRCIFDMFKDANKMHSLLDNNYKIPNKIMKPVKQYYMKNIKKPNSKSLIESAMKSDKLVHCPISQSGKQCKINEIMAQIPHWVFPMMKQLFATIPRILLMLCNHKNIFKKVIYAIKNLDENDPNQIYNCKILRNCILEMLRLNSVTMTTLRKLKTRYSFDLNRKYTYKPGEQFLILNNPVMREPEKFRCPNQFKPDRWAKDKDLENSYYSIMFGQGPQRCPGKEIGIFLGQAFLVHYLKAVNFNIKTKRINTKYIEQMINFLELRFYTGNCK